MTGRDTFVVAIDGPGGVGKSTVSRRVAEALDATHVDTGAFYRAATLVVLEAGADPSVEAEVVEAVDGVAVDQTEGRTTVDGRDVSREIRSDEVTDAVSHVSAHPVLRRLMVDTQRRCVGRDGKRAVVEGRDIGTVVFPDADVKVYLDADPAVRAARRSGELGGDASLVQAALTRRDELDSTRPSSPLAMADDAVLVDTTDLDVDAVVAEVMSLVDAALPG